jgi:hypothetical protein
MATGADSLATNDAARESRPTWAPGDNTLAFARRRAGSDAEVCTLYSSTR